MERPSSLSSMAKSQELCMSGRTVLRLLLLETSGQPGWVALADGSTIRSRRALDRARRHARDLAPSIAELLREGGWRPGDIDAVLAGRGPGSYTGLRVGLITAKTFAFATGCRLIGIDTFAAIALQASQSEPAAQAREVDILADAQQNKVYVQRFAVGRGPELPRAILPLRILPVTDWLNQLTPEIWVSGPGLLLHRDRLPGYVPVVGEGLWHPQPESVLVLGLDRLNRGEQDEWGTLEPLYLRPSAAEEKQMKG
jgi:tRNA threonylcarbamoyladenosine biosynthesis protein TsaB